MFSITYILWIFNNFAKNDTAKICDLCKITILYGHFDISKEQTIRRDKASVQIDLSHDK